MDLQMVFDLSEKIISRPVLIVMLYVISLGWMISFIFQNRKYKKLLTRCEDLQTTNVKVKKELWELTEKTKQLSCDLRKEE